MPGKRNIIKKTNWSYLIPQIALFFLMAAILQQLKVNNYWLLSLAIYLLLSGYLKVIVPKWHRRGLFYVRKGELEGAAYAFQKSYDFFSRNAWVDKYRAFTLFSLSGYSYKEMALMNMIFCYERLNDLKTAKKLLKQLAGEFPDNPYGKGK